MRADGIYPDVPDVEYHSDVTTLSSTGARKLLPPSTPAHFRQWRDNPQPPTDAFDLGHVTHSLVLGKGAEFVVLDPEVHGLKKDGTMADNPRATATWKAAAAEARAQGKTPIHVEDHRAALAMADAVFRNTDANAAFAGNGQPEVTVYATDPETGVRLRARFDWLDGGYAVDLKTAQSAEPRDFERAAAKFGYHVQEMFYRHVAELAGLDIARFRFVVVEKTPPHLVTVHEWDEEARRFAAGLVRDAIRQYRDCIRDDVWPPYEPGVHEMCLPSYLFDELELKL
jgi:hypothetical protein